MEVDAAKKSSHLVVLSDLQNSFNRNSKVKPDTCLIEQESQDREKTAKETVHANAVRMKQKQNTLPSESDFKASHTAEWKRKRVHLSSANSPR